MSCDGRPLQVTDSANEIVVLISPNAAGMRSLRVLKGNAVTPYMTGKPSSAAALRAQFR